MKKKYLFIITSIISAFVLIYVGVGTTYSKFTATSDTVLQAEVTAKLDYTVYFLAPPDWRNFKTGNVEVYAYMWGDGDIKNATYPGLQIYEDNSLGISGVYKCVIPADKPYKHIIFSNGALDSVPRDSDNEEMVYGKKTVDLNVTDNNATINNKIFVPEIYKGNGIRTMTYLFGVDCYKYLWNSSGVKEAEWPGTSITSNYISNRAYSTIVDNTTYQYVIFSKYVSSTNTLEYQTTNLYVPDKQDLTCIIRSRTLRGKNYAGNYEGVKTQSMWRRLFYFGSWYSINDWVNDEGNIRTSWQNVDYVKFNETKAMEENASSGDGVIEYNWKDVVR